jgi:hypothetical protein
MPRSVFAIGMSVASLLVASGVILFFVVGTSAGLPLIILGFLAVVMTALFTALESGPRV